MKQGREETGFRIKTYDVVKTAELDFSKALGHMTNELIEKTDDDNLSSFVDAWWSDLRNVYRALHLSLGAEGGTEVSLFYLQIRVLHAIWNLRCKYESNWSLGQVPSFVTLTNVEPP